jgi:ABC-2 type transport system permease protein
MAGVSGGGQWTAAGAHKGPFSRLALAQYATLLGMRWLVLSNTLRTLPGVLELSARGLGLLVYGSMGLGLSIALGSAANIFSAHDEWTMLALVFWSALFIWQSVPVGLASFQTQFEMSTLLRFPVSFGSFFLLSLVVGMADISTILGGLCSIGIWMGIALARPQLALWALAVVGLFGIFNILLVRLILLWLDRWLARRRSRELVGAVIVMLLLSLQLLNPALQSERPPRSQLQPRHFSVESVNGEEKDIVAQTVLVVQHWFPPGLAATVVRRASSGHANNAGTALAGLGLYVAAVAGLLGMRLKAEFRGENLGEAEAAGAESQRSYGMLLNGAGPIAAVMEKELRTMIRSMPLLYAMGAPLFMVIVLSSLLHNNAPARWRGLDYALPGCLAYALMGVSQLLYNALGTDGTGVRLIFLSPTPVRTVMLAKNLFHGLAFGVVACAAWVMTSLRMGWPDNVMAAATVAWLMFALLANLAIGNVFSLVMPHRVDLGRLTRQRGSAASSLLSMSVQLLLLGVGGAVFFVCSMSGRLWLAVPVFLVLAAAASYAWLRIFNNLDALVSRRKDLLNDTLAKTE